MAKDKQVLNGESNNGSSKDKQVLEGESSNATRGNQVLTASKSLGLLPLAHIKYSAAKNKLIEVYGKLFQNGYTSKGDVILPHAGSTVQTTNHNTMDIESGGTDQANRGSSKFWVCLKLSFFLICFSLEVISFVLEELSPDKNPNYALVGMVVSIITLIICIAELVWKGKKEKVTWKRRGKKYWFYDPNNKIFGTFPDIFGLIFGILEFITSTITYALILRDKTNPIDLPFCSIVFAALILCSKYPIDQDDADPQDDDNP